MKLKINSEDAIIAYKNADASGKALLIDLFGRHNEIFGPQKITDRIQGWNDILEITGAHAEAYQLRPGEEIDELAYRQAKLISTAYNEGKEIRLTDTTQKKYFAWYYIVKDSSHSSGFGLSFGGVGYVGSDTVVASRLCFVDEVCAKDAAIKFGNTVYANLLIR